ncbi:MAG: ABC transporter ATP-binding protein [Bacillota bacterium]|nr:ABC transporter ATP-binding protein [Bacillota bacterium]
MKQNNNRIKKTSLAIKYFLRILSLLSKAGKKYIFYIIFFALIFSITPSMSLLLMEKIINTLQLSTHGLNYIIKLLIIYISIDLVNGISSLLSNYFENIFQMKISLIIDRSILEKTREFSLKDFEDSETYDRIQRALSVTSSRIFNFFKSFISMFQLLINIILFSLILLSWNWWIVPLILLIPLINTIVTAYFGKVFFNIYKERAPKERKRWYFQYLLTKDFAFKEIKIFNLNKYIRDKYNDLSVEFFKQDKKITDKRMIFQILLFFLDQLISSFLFVFIILQTFLGNILLGQLVSYTRSISNVKSNTQGFLSQINSIYESMLYIGQYFEFIDMKSMDKYFKIEDKEALKMNFKISNIKIRNLYYKYNENDKPVINNLNLNIESNSLIAFIGRNGSGKSTLVKILSTLYKDYQGDIYIDNYNLKDLDQDEIKKRIGVLFQDFVKYELTVRENIAFGDLSKMEKSKDILESLKKTGMDNRLNDIDEQLGYWFDDGIQLSGGEWLKIALSRAFIRDADLYLLDEPNSALDSISEKIILKSFKSLVRDKIGIIVSHRITSIKNIVDKIIVFDEGSIEAIGTHEELLTTSKTYREMYYSEIAEEY